jgi:hypothetical protein
LGTGFLAALPFAIGSQSLVSDSMLTRGRRTGRA